MTSFAELNLSPLSLQAIQSAGYQTPTPIQVQAIPPALAGKDVIGTAATGTGKTAAFVLPILERLAGKTGTRALVLAPTRELALQIGEELARFTQGRKVRGAVVIGGVGMGAQVQAFRGRTEVIIATPGRLVDHLQQGTAKLDDIEILVLDEADRMLDMGFKPQLTKILARVPKVRQTMLFSATMGNEVADFARAALKTPVRVEVARSGTLAQRATQQVFLAGQMEKLPLLHALLEEDNQTTLVFTRTKHRADKVAKSLATSGHAVARIHANRSQSQRKLALDGFKDGTYRVLVATDIAARGIDVEKIGHVVNFDLPHVPEDYVHRIGRTARAECTGRASSFASPEEMDLLRDIERFTRAVIPRAVVPRDSARFTEHMARSKERPSMSERPARGPRQTPARGAARPGTRAARPAVRSSGGASPGGTGKLVGSWRPKRR